MKAQTENLPAVVVQSAKDQGVDLANAIVLLPTKTFGQIVGRYEKVAVEEIVVDPEPANGEVYPTENGGFAFAKPVLDKIANAIGLQWDPRYTTDLESSTMKSRSQAAGVFRKPNGEFVRWVEAKTIDLEVFEEEQRLSCEERAEKGNPDKVTKWGKTNSGKSYPAEFESWKSEEERLTWIDRKVRRAVLQKRKFKDELARSGAKERVIRHAVALKANYSKEEISRRFIIPRVITDTDKLLADPNLREYALGGLFNGAASIYGPAAIRDETPQKQALPEPEEDQDEPEPAITISGDDGGDEQPPTAEGTDELPFDLGDSPEKQLRAEIVSLLPVVALADSKVDEIKSSLENKQDSWNVEKLTTMRDWVRQHCSQEQEA